MGDVINLNRYRKAKEKAERAKLAGESRVRHGLSLIHISEPTRPY